MNGLDVLHRDNHLLVVRKPAGVPSVPDASGDESLLDAATVNRFNAELDPLLDLHRPRAACDADPHAGHPYPKSVRLSLA